MCSCCRKRKVDTKLPVIERPFACILVFGVAEVLPKHAVLAHVQIQVEILGDCSDAGGGIEANCSCTNACFWSARVTCICFIH